MARTNLLAAVLISAVVALSCAANADLASTVNLIEDISSQFVGQPGYEGLRTYAVYVQFTDPADRLLITSGDVSALAGGCFVNADSVADDPLGVIDDVTGGNLPLIPSIIALRGYDAWGWDTNLSVDNNPESFPYPGTLLDTALIHGGAYILPRPIGAAAGPDLLVQIAQITVSTPTAFFSGTMSVGYQDALSQGFHTAQVFIGTLSPPEVLVGDLNGDEAVNTLDLGILLSSWSLPAARHSPGCGSDPCCPSDLDHDGFVNSLDLGILLSNWSFP